MPAADTLSDHADLLRYMDLSRFLAMFSPPPLALWFAAPAALEDAREGFAQRESGYYDDYWTDRIVVCSWTNASSESISLWKSYALNGVAVGTTARRLRDLEIAGAQPVYVDKCIYRPAGPDGSKMPDLLSRGPGGVQYEAVRTKLPAYKAEDEVRAWLRPKEPSAMGLRVRIPPDFVTRIVVSPYGPSWSLQAVEGLVRTFGYDWPVEKSRIEVRVTGR